MSSDDTETLNIWQNAEKCGAAQERGRILKLIEFEIEYYNYRSWLHRQDDIVIPVLKKLVEDINRGEKMTNEQPSLDIEAIKARLAESKFEGKEISYLSWYDEGIEIGFGPKPTKLEDMTDEQEVFFINAPTDIAALLAEMDRVKLIAAGVHIRNVILELNEKDYKVEIDRLRGENERLKNELKWTNYGVLPVKLDDFEGIGTEGD